jgi:hypothetical protein
MDPGLRRARQNVAMLYDLSLAKELCDELGFRASLRDQILEVDLGAGALLVLENWEAKQDCLIGFLGTAWHGHGDLIFMDAAGYYTELDYLNVLTGLKEGRVLVCERWIGARLDDRWLTHDRYNDDLRHMEGGERIVVRRARSPKL